MAKPLAEQSNSISIFMLKKWGYINSKGGQSCGVLTWTSFGYENSINFKIITTSKDEPDDCYIKISYSYSDIYSDDKESLDYKIELTTTECNYGGTRYWFRCPLIRNGHACNKRVGVLYQAGKYFGCRYCADISYKSQRQGGNYRESSITIYDIENFENEITKYYYKGKPTKKHLRLKKMRDRFEKDFYISVSLLI